MLEFAFRGFVRKPRDAGNYGGWIVAVIFLSFFSLLSSASGAAAIDENDVQTQLMEGYRYQHEDAGKALTLFRGVVENGGDLRGGRRMVQQAQYALCEIYRDGEGIKKDYAEAEKWCRKVAELKERAFWDPVRLKQAQGILGTLYREGGYGLKQDYTEAKKWLLLGADESDEAKAGLSLMYAKGLGVPQDKAQAYKWCTLSGGCGDKDKTCAETLGLTLRQLEQGKILVDQVYGEHGICSHYDASLHPSCWGGTSCAYGSPYLFNLDGRILLACLLIFSAGLFRIISIRKFSKYALPSAILTVLLTLYISGGDGGIENFIQEKLGIAAVNTGRLLVYLDFAMMFACLFGGAAGALFFTCVKKDRGAGMLSLIIFMISLLNILIEFVVAVLGA